MLLRAGTNADTKDRWNGTVILFAIGHENKEIAKRFIESGTDSSGIQ